MLPTITSDRIDLPPGTLLHFPGTIADYEYTEILEKLGYGDWAMKIVRGVGKNWHQWTKDPQTLELARQKLGEKIHSSS